MNANQLSAIAVRLYALHLLLASLFEAEQTVNMASRASSGGPNFHDLIPAGLLFAVALFLLLQTDVVVSVITRGIVTSSVAALDSSQLVTAAFSLAGVVFLVSGLASLAAVVVHSLVPANPLRPDVPTQALASNAAFALVRCLMGLWLFVGARQVLALVGHLRSMASPPADADA